MRFFYLSSTLTFNRAVLPLHLPPQQHPVSKALFQTRARVASRWVLASCLMKTALTRAAGPTRTKFTSAGAFPCTAPPRGRGPSPHTAVRGGRRAGNGPGAGRYRHLRAGAAEGSPRCPVRAPAQPSNKLRGKGNLPPPRPLPLTGRDRGVRKRRRLRYTPPHPPPPGAPKLYSSVPCPPPPHHLRGGAERPGSPPFTAPWRPGPAPGHSPRVRSSGRRKKRWAHAAKRSQRLQPGSRDILARAAEPHAAG